MTTAIVLRSGRVDEMAATVRRALSFGSRSKRQPVDSKVAGIDVVAAEGEAAGAARPPAAADEPAAAPPASLAPAPVAAAAPKASAKLGNDSKASATNIVRRALSFGSISSSMRATPLKTLQPTPGGPLVPPLKLGTSNPWPEASDDDSEEESDDEPVDAPAGIRGRSASASSPPAPRGTRIAVVATKVTVEDEDGAERGATAAVRLVSCAATAAKSAPAHRRHPWQPEAMSGSSVAIRGSVRVHLQLSLCRQAAVDDPNMEAAADDPTMEAAADDPNMEAAADDPNMVSTCVRVALRLVTTSAVPSTTWHTFPYAAPLGMYLAQRDSFVIVETVIPSMQAAEAGVVPGAVVLSMHRRSGEDAIWMDLAGMLRDEIIAQIEQVPPLTTNASDGL
jgi:hypothetical protein